MTKQEFVNLLVNLKAGEGFDVEDTGSDFVWGIRIINIIDTEMLVYGVYGNITYPISLNDFYYGNDREERLTNVAIKIYDEVLLGEPAYEEMEVF